MAENPVSNLAAQVMLDERERMLNAIDLFRPTVAQEPFFRKMAGKEILEIAVGGGNRAGKSLCVAVWFAAMVLNKPVTMRNGEKIHMRPEHWRTEGLEIWLIGFNWDHIGKTLYRLLFTDRSTFRIIRDKKTKQWRAYDPTRPEDKDMLYKTRPAPALIRWCDVKGGFKGMSFENKKERQFKSFHTHDGTVVRAFASTGAIPQGDPCHMIWVDERLFDEERWYSELMARLMDHRGRLLWTSWPTTAPSSCFSAISERSKVQDGKPDQRTFMFTFSGDDNPFNAGGHRDAIMDTMDEDTRQARGAGILNLDRWRVYPRFTKHIHRALPEDPETDDSLAAEIRKNNSIPWGWTRYFIFDPGTANPGILAVAIPPPHLGNYIVPYEEMYPHYCDAAAIAKMVGEKFKGQFFEDLISDAHACRQTPMGFSGTVGQNYERHFALENIRGRRNGYRFSYGSDDITSRIMRVQATMTIQSNGKPRLRIFGCPELCKQLENYRWGADPRGNPTDMPARYQKIDIAQCLEYLTSRDDCGYVEPPPTPIASANSPESIGEQIRKAMGIEQRPADKSVYLGAGRPNSI